MISKSNKKYELQAMKIHTNFTLCHLNYSYTYLATQGLALQRVTCTVGLSLAAHRLSATFSPSISRIQASRVVWIPGQQQHGFR